MPVNAPATTWLTNYTSPKMAAVAGNGSGLIGLKDRVEAIAGRLNISSPAGGGTALVVTIPLQTE